MILPKELTTVTPLSKTIALVMFTLLPIIAFLIGMQHQRNLSEQPTYSNSQQKTCTEEGRICPDGSVVGRTGPDCEFAPCPTTGISVNQNEEKFRGKITDMRYSCHVDGICDIVIGAKRVIVQKGEESLTHEPSGVMWGISLNENSKNNFLGGNIEVFARKLESNVYTLYGSTRYYVKFLDKEFSNGYRCPSSSWVNCMPSPGIDMRYCSKKYLDWAKANCTGFKGAGY